MKTFLTKAFLAFILVIAPQFAGAVQCYENTRQIPAGSPPLIMQNGQFCTGRVNQGSGVTTVITEQVVARPDVHGDRYSGFDKCEIVGGIGGGTLGSFARNYRGQAIVLGAIVGAVVGDAICDDRGRRALVPANEVNLLRQQQILVGFTCTTGGETFMVSSEAQCARMAGKLGGQRAEPAAEKYKLEATTIPSSGEANNCRLRIRGQVVAQKPVPSHLNDAEAKSFCDQWQRGEARNRGLI